MESVTGYNGISVGFDVLGSGPPLVLVHGVFTDRLSNWITVRDGLAERFTVYAVDRRGRGATSALPAESTRDEFDDVAAVIRSVADPVFILGHSYGAHVALGAASLLPDRVRGLILYEPPTTALLSPETARALDEDARSGDWDAFVSRFFAKVAHASTEELEAIRSSPIWSMLVAGAEPTFSDIRAFRSYEFDPTAFGSLSIPVTFLCGSKSPSIQFVTTNALMATLPDARCVDLEGQGHDGMYADPRGFIETVIRVFGA